MSNAKVMSRLNLNSRFRTTKYGYLVLSTSAKKLASIVEQFLLEGLQWVAPLLTRTYRRCTVLAQGSLGQALIDPLSTWFNFTTDRYR